MAPPEEQRENPEKDVALARNLNLPLVTVDKKIISAFSGTAVSLKKFIA